MLLELAIGDAYGAGFEYVDREMIRQHNNLSCYVKHPRHNIQPGSYTDDTHRNIRPTSAKSGAALRAAPIGIYPTLSLVIERCTIQAALTHNTPDGINAAVAAALMTHYFLYNLGPKKELGIFLEEHVRGHWATPWTGKVKSQGWMSVQAAVTALLRSDTMRELLKTCIQFSGDVDTVAAIALAAGSCSTEIAQDLPVHLIDALENGQYGRDYIHLLDTQLMAFFAQ